MPVAATHITTVFRSLALTLALMLCGPVLAAGLTCAKPADSSEVSRTDEPEEAVSLKDHTLSGKDMQAWLRQLVGQFTYQGYVDLCGKGNPADQRPVTGRADCIAAGLTPNVHCLVNVSWPAATKVDGSRLLGGVSNLSPAEFVFSIEIPRPLMFRGKAANGWGLVFLQLDNRGNAQWASGVLVGDTFIATEPCTDMPGDCRRKTKITVRPDSNISMVVDTHIDRKRVLRQAFQLQRKPNARPAERSPGSVP
jgi:hypothetical protein